MYHVGVIVDPMDGKGYVRRFSIKGLALFGVLHEGSIDVESCTVAYAAHLKDYGILM